MSNPSTLKVSETSDLAARLVTASGSIRVPRALRDDTAIAALLIVTLIQAGVIAGPVQLGGRRDG